MGAGSRNEFVGDRMRIPSEMDGGTWYERVEPWTPTPAELASLAGEYTSDEAEVTFRVAWSKAASSSIAVRMM